jgi:hypothetical protein
MATCSPGAIVLANSSRKICIVAVEASGMTSAKALSVPGSAAAKR